MQRWWFSCTGIFFRLRYHASDMAGSERNAENKMVVVQEKIGGGLKTGALSPDQSQMFLTTLKGIRTDYTALRDKRVYRDEWDRLNAKLDELGDEINRALARPSRIEEPRDGDRIVALQRRIDDAKNQRTFALFGRTGYAIEIGVHPP